MKLPVQPRFNTITLLILSLCAGFFVLFPVTDSDIFWHLAAGRKLFENGRFLFTDPFCYTPSAVRWIDLHWLFQAIMYRLYALGGFPLLLAAKWGITSAAVLLLFTACSRSRTILLLSPLFCMLLYGQRYLIPMRPVIFTLFFISAYIFSYEKLLTSHKARWSAALVTTQIAWVNSQGLFLIGPIIACLYGAGEFTNQQLHRYAPNRFRYPASHPPRIMTALALLPVLLVLASLINPYGFRVFPFATGLLQRITPSAANIYSSMIDENLPLLRMAGTAYSRYVFITGATALLLLSSSAASWRNMRIALLGLAAAGFCLAFMAQRNGIIFTFLAFPALTYTISHIRKPHRRLPPLILQTLHFTSIGALCLFMLSHIMMLRNWPHTVSPFTHPTESSRYLQTHSIQGNIFNADRYGGYLIWKLYPQHKVFCDTRLALKSDDFFRSYLTLIKDPTRFDTLVKQWNITVATLPLAPVTQYQPLARYLYHHPGWHLVFTDGAEALFRSDSIYSDSGISLEDSTTVTAIADQINTRYKTSAPVRNEALLRFSRWCELTGALNSARQVIDTLSDLQCRMQLARIKDILGDTAAAEQILTSEHTAHPRNNHITMSLIYFYLNHGHDEKALRHLGKLLRAHPFYPPARTLLFTLKKEKGTP